MCVSSRSPLENTKVEQTDNYIRIPKGTSVILPDGMEVEYGIQCIHEPGYEPEVVKGIVTRKPKYTTVILRHTYEITKDGWRIVDED